MVSQRISGCEDRPRAWIPDDEGEHTVDATEDGWAQLEVRTKRKLGICAGGIRSRDVGERLFVEDMTVEDGHGRVQPRDLRRRSLPRRRDLWQVATRLETQEKGRRVRSDAPFLGGDRHD